MEVNELLSLGAPAQITDLCADVCAPREGNLLCRDKLFRNSRLNFTVIKVQFRFNV
jgi:hypothetical protein